MDWFVAGEYRFIFSNPLLLFWLDLLPDDRSNAWNRPVVDKWNNFQPQAC